MSYLVGETKREQYVRWVKGTAGAGRAAGSAYAVKVEHKQQGFALNAEERDVDISCQPVLHSAVYAAGGYLRGYSADNAVTELGNALLLCGDIGASVFYCLSKSDDRRHIFSSRTLASFLSAAVDKVGQIYSLAHIKEADSLLCVNFMT